MDKLLIEEAYKASLKSYSFYSKFNVGASLLLNDNKIISSFNIENKSYSLTICAERNVIYHAYSLGYKKENIKKICVIAHTDYIITPCGACREVMLELLNSDTEIIMANKNKEFKKIIIRDLLPYPFEVTNE